MDGVDTTVLSTLLKLLNTVLVFCILSTALEYSTVDLMQKSSTSTTILLVLDSVVLILETADREKFCTQCALSTV